MKRIHDTYISQFRYGGQNGCEDGSVEKRFVIGNVCSYGLKHFRFSDLQTVHRSATQYASPLSLKRQRQVFIIE